MTPCAGLSGRETGELAGRVTDGMVEQQGHGVAVRLAHQPTAYVLEITGPHPLRLVVLD